MGDDINESVAEKYTLFIFLRFYLKDFLIYKTFYMAQVWVYIKDKVGNNIPYSYAQLCTSSSAGIGGFKLTTYSNIIQEKDGKIVITYPDNATLKSVTTFPIYYNDYYYVSTTASNFKTSGSTSTITIYPKFYKATDSSKIACNDFCNQIETGAFTDETKCSTKQQIQDTNLFVVWDTTSKYKTNQLIPQNMVKSTRSVGKCYLMYPKTNAIADSTPQSCTYRLAGQTIENNCTFRVLGSDIVIDDSSIISICSGSVSETTIFTVTYSTNLGTSIKYFYLQSSDKQRIIQSPNNNIYLNSASSEKFTVNASVTGFTGTVRLTGSFRYKTPGSSVFSGAIINATSTSGMTIVSWSSDELPVGTEYYFYNLSTYPFNADLVWVPTLPKSSSDVGLLMENTTYNAMWPRS